MISYDVASLATYFIYNRKHEILNTNLVFWRVLFLVKMVVFISISPEYWIWVQSTGLLVETYVILVNGNTYFIHGKSTIIHKTMDFIWYLVFWSLENGWP